MPQGNRKVQLYPQMELNDQLIRRAASAVHKTGSEDKINARWDYFKTLCKTKNPDPGITGNVLQFLAGTGSMKGIHILCNLNEQSEPTQYHIENALQIAKNAKHSQVARYLSCELIRRKTLNADSLQMTQNILQDFVKHTPFISFLFSGQARAVKNILSQVKHAAAKEGQEEARNEAVSQAVTDLKQIMGQNQDLITYINYIVEHLPQQAQHNAAQANIK